MGCKAIGLDIVDWLCQDQDRLPVNMVMELQVPSMMRNFLAL
jgi:hypothetical protein